MRLRHIKDGHDLLKKHAGVITQPENYRGGLENFFDRSNPIHIELGSGKGKFIRELSNLNNDINYLGFEMSTKVIFRWLSKIELEGMNDNYYIVHSKADMINKIFDENTIDRIYLNFSDPWPKPRHEKRRLTSPYHLNMYKKVLRENGSLIMKTDNRELFQYSLDTLKQMNWDIEFYTFDLYNTSYIENNIQTEYEEKFVSEGKHICMLIANKPIDTKM